MRLDLFVLVLVGFGCARDVAPEPEPLCYFSLAVEGVEEGDDVDPNTPLPSVSNRQWRELLLQSGGRDCTGQEIRPQATVPRCATQPAAEPNASDTAMTKVKRLGAGRFLVFVQTGDSGSHVEGVVALVQQDVAGLTVEAFGHIRARSERLRFKFELLGDGQELVVADGESCVDETCTRELSILLRTGEALRQLPVVTENSRQVCTQLPVLELARGEQRSLETGWERSFRLVASWEPVGDSIMIREQVNISDVHPDHASMPPQPFREINSERRWRLSQNTWVESDRPLLDRVLDQNGSTTHRPATH